MKKHNILIVGAGRIGSKRAKVARKLSPKSEIFIYDTDHKRAISLAKEIKGTALSSLEEGLKNKKIDIAIVAVINKFSRPTSILALKNNKNVLCEKPMGINYKDALEIYKIAKKYRRKFKCGFNHRYHPAIQEAHKLCKEKTIGKILYIRTVYGHGGRSGYNKEWRAKKHLSGGGELIDQGSHLIDLCLWFFSFEKIKRVFGITKSMFWGMKVDDNAFIILETASGKVAQVHASWTQWKNKFTFEIYGTKGAIEIEGLGGSYGTETIRIYKRLKAGEVPLVKEKKYKAQDNSWKKEWLDFLTSVDKKIQPMSSHKESLEVMKIIDKIYNQ